MNQPQPTRLNKYLSEIGFCSRRRADKYIEAGRITLNGSVPEMGTKVTGEEDIRLDGKKIRDKKEEPVYLAFNKPVGIVCTTDTSVEKDNIIDYIKYPTRIFPVGRLDKVSQGLILLTNDGDIVNKILRARNNHDKEYIVQVDRPITSRFIDEMSSGVPILDTVTRKCSVVKISDHRFRIILTQGLNRQIRRMCEYLDYRVVSLQRTRIMNVKLDVPTGKYRQLTIAELAQLQEAVADSAGAPLKPEDLANKNPVQDNHKSFRESAKTASSKRKRRER